MVGEKCDVIFQLNDAGGNGWRGASVSVVESGRRIAVVELENGGDETRVVPLLKGELSFYWNSGWFSAMDDNEISFTIYDAVNNELFASPDSLVQGFLFSFDNICDNALNCMSPIDFEGEYRWNDDGFGAFLSWSLSADYLTGFNIYRSNDNESYYLLATVSSTTTSDYEYFDETDPDTYFYRICATYQMEDEYCESEPAMTPDGENFVVVTVTSSVEKPLDNISMYPNPTDGELMIKNDNITSVEVYNLVGQMVGRIACKSDEVILDMSAFENGVYFIRIMNGNSCFTKRVVLNR